MDLERNSMFSRRLAMLATFGFMVLSIVCLAIALSSNSWRSTTSRTNSTATDTATITDGLWGICGISSKCRDKGVAIPVWLLAVAVLEVTAMVTCGVNLIVYIMRINTHLDTEEHTFAKVLGCLLLLTGGLILLGCIVYVILYSSGDKKLFSALGSGFYLALTAGISSLLSAFAAFMDSKIVQYDILENETPEVAVGQTAHSFKTKKKISLNKRFESLALDKYRKLQKMYH